MDYATLYADLQNLLQDADNSADFQQIIPAAIQDAEGRIYREMDFLATRQQTASVTATIGNRNITLPSSVLVVEGISAISPAGNAPTAGTRNPVERCSLDFIDMTWNVEATKSLPLFFAQLDATTAVLAPTPDAAYKIEVTGIYKPTPLSASNTTTYITLTYPDLMLAACMTFMSAYQRDPAMAGMWETAYQDRKKSVMEEEQRRKSQSTGWSTLSPAPLATPQRS